jgi:hypothetical protein
MFESSTNFALGTTLITLAQFAGMLGALALGQRIARERAKRGVEGAQAGAVSAAVFGLLGLLIAFTFSGAAERFDNRRTLIVEEANALGTAYLRLDLLAPSARTALQEKFRRYVDARLAAYRASSTQGFGAENARAIALQGEIWSDSVKAAGEAGTPAFQVLLPSINEAIDITTTRSAALETHPPSAIYVVLMLLALFSALLAGIDLSPTEPNRVLKVVFAAAISLTIYLTLDIEHPRLGLIRISDADHFLVEARQGMK